MKKNFLMVASLLIAAMLMVVSCTQEVAPKNELVEVKLSTVFGRDIEITGGTDTTSLTYKYTMTPNWNGWKSSDDNVGIGGVDGERISGIVSTETPVGKDKSLGWVTPGLWTVKVYAYDGTQKVFEGENDAYFSNKNDKVTVYLQPADDATTSLTFEIKMQDLDTNGGSYTLKYTVVGTPSIPNTTHTTETSVSDELVRVPGESTNNISVYKLKSDDNKLSALPSDYYRVTVSIYDGDNTLLGGITKGVLLSNGDAGKVTGNIEPSDYINAQFNVKLFDVVTSLTSGDVTYFSDNNYTTQTTEDTANLAKSAKAVITLNDTTTITKYDAQITDSDYAKVSKWYIDGELAAAEDVSVDRNGKPTVTVKDTKPGYKNVSCQTIYYKQLGDTVYYWANTASIQVKFDGNRFAKDSI